MSHSLKGIICTVTFVIALIAGIYLTGMIFLIINEGFGAISHVKLTTVFSPLSNFSTLSAQEQKSFLISSAIGFGLPMIIVIVVVIKLFLGDYFADKKMYGDAKFTSKRDLAKAGFYNAQSTSVIVGIL